MEAPMKEEIEKVKDNLKPFEGHEIVEGCIDDLDAEEYLEATKPYGQSGRRYGVFKFSDSHIMTVESWGPCQSNIYSFFKQASGEYMHVDDNLGNKWWIEIENGHVKSIGVAKFYDAGPKS